jgi:hypothetical protein
MGSSGDPFKLLRTLGSLSSCEPISATPSVHNGKATMDTFSPNLENLQKDPLNGGGRHCRDRQSGAILFRGPHELHCLGVISTIPWDYQNKFHCLARLVRTQFESSFSSHSVWQHPAISELKNLCRRFRRLAGVLDGQSRKWCRFAAHCCRSPRPVSCR